MLPAMMPSDELSGILPAPTVACCKGTQPKGALAKPVIARLNRGQSVPAKWTPVRVKKTRQIRI
jgi:hypothetical protein